MNNYQYTRTPDGVTLTFDVKMNNHTLEDLLGFKRWSLARWLVLWVFYILHYGYPRPSRYSKTLNDIPAKRDLHLEIGDEAWDMNGVYLVGYEVSTYEGFKTVTADFSSRKPLTGMR